MYISKLMDTNDDISLHGRVFTNELITWNTMDKSQNSYAE